MYPDMTINKRSILFSVGLVLFIFSERCVISPSFPPSHSLSTRLPADFGRINSARFSFTSATVPGLVTNPPFQPSSVCPASESLRNLTNSESRFWPYSRTRRASTVPWSANSPYGKAVLSARWVGFYILEGHVLKSGQWCSRLQPPSGRTVVGGFPGGATKQMCWASSDCFWSSTGTTNSG